MADDKSEKAQNPRNIRPPRGAEAPGRPKKAAVTRGEAMDTSGLGRVVVRNEFYRDGYRLALRVAVIQCFVIFGLIGAMFFIIYVHQPENRYFATTEDGRLIPMVPLNQPNLSTPALLSWVAQAASETMSFSFSNYRRSLQESSRHFTRAGWESFSAALQQARIIESVEANTQELTTVPRGARGPRARTQRRAAGCASRADRLHPARRRRDRHCGADPSHRRGRLRRAGQQRRRRQTSQHSEGR